MVFVWVVSWGGTQQGKKCDCLESRYARKLHEEGWRGGVAAPHLYRAAQARVGGSVGRLVG